MDYNKINFLLRKYQNENERVEFKSVIRMKITYNEKKKRFQRLLIILLVFRNFIIFSRSQPFFLENSRNFRKSRNKKFFSNRNFSKLGIIFLLRVVLN